MGDRRCARLVRIGIVGVVGVALSACGVDPAPSAKPSDPAPAVPEQADDRTAAAVEVPVPRLVPAQAQEGLDQPAIWPAAGVVFATPEEAATDFVSAVLISEGDPVLGAFQQGDARSGEIEVSFAGEAGDLDPPMPRGTLLLRQIGPTDGWYVIAATGEGAVIDSPSALAELPAGTVTVSGEGRGFEGTLVVSAFPPGDEALTYDLQIGAGGAVDDVEPYAVALDLSGAADGAVVVILVRGDTGLGSDPGPFAAIPVVIGSSATATIPPTK